MLNYGIVTSEKGARIIFIFEDDRFKNELSKNAPSQKAFQEVTCERINRMRMDTGKGTSIYILINSSGMSKILNESEYIQWQDTAKKDWFYQYVYAF